MKGRRTDRAHERALINRPLGGLTLVELLLAVALFSFLMVAVFQLFDRSLSLWQRGETQRGLLEQSSVIGELVARDLRALDGGPRGDLLVEWVAFDTDGDRLLDVRWPRLRLVRQASAAELARTGAPPGGPRTSALVEVVWCVTPASESDRDARSEGILWRGQRLCGGEAGESFFDPSFFTRTNLPPPDEVLEVTDGLLWMGVLLASQTSIVHDAWTIGDDLAGAGASWDAWVRGRPDPGVHEWNEPGSGMPAAHDLPLLPRRVRIDLEFERPADRRRRTRLATPLAADETALQVEDGRRVPADGHVLIDAEWMRVVSVSADRVVVARGARGSSTARHEAGAMLHCGVGLSCEVPVAAYREDWDL